MSRLTKEKLKFMETADIQPYGIRVECLGQRSVTDVISRIEKDRAGGEFGTAYLFTGASLNHKTGVINDIAADIATQWIANAWNLNSDLVAMWGGELTDDQTDQIHAAISTEIKLQFKLGKIDLADLRKVHSIKNGEFVPAVFKVTLYKIED